MTQEEQILASIEEIGHKIDELKKLSKDQPISQIEIDLTPLLKRHDKLEQTLSLMKSGEPLYKEKLEYISLEVLKIGQILQPMKEVILHRYIEVKKPLVWISSGISYFLISIAVIFALYQTKRSLETENVSMKQNDLKYRFLKLRDESLSDIRNTARTMSELTYYIDSYYEKSPKEIEKYVITKEEEIKKAFQAAELAKQKDAEARAAKEEADKLKMKLKKTE